MMTGSPREEEPGPNYIEFEKNHHLTEVHHIKLEIWEHHLLRGPSQRLYIGVDMDPCGKY
jgi:hypothetical protein